MRNRSTNMVVDYLIATISQAFEPNSIRFPGDGLNSKS